METTTVIKSQKEITDLADAKRKELEESLTDEAMRKLFPRDMKEQSKEIELASLTYREIPISKLEEFIAKAKEAGVDKIYFHEDRDCDGDFNSLDISYTTFKPESMSDYERRLKTARNRFIAMEVEKYIAPFKRQYDEYRQYLNLSKKFAQ